MGNIEGFCMSLDIKHGFNPLPTFDPLKFSFNLRFQFFKASNESSNERYRESQLDQRVQHLNVIALTWLNFQVLFLNFIRQLVQYILYFIFGATFNLLKSFFLCFSILSETEKSTLATGPVTHIKKMPDTGSPATTSKSLAQFILLHVNNWETSLLTVYKGTTELNDNHDVLFCNHYVICVMQYLLFDLINTHNFISLWLRTNVFREIIKQFVDKTRQSRHKNDSFAFPEYLSWKVIGEERK